MQISSKVHNISDIIVNIRHCESKRTNLESLSTSERKFYQELISRGNNFIPYSTSDGIGFIQSKFAAYKDNNMNDHKNAPDRGAGVSDGILTSVLGHSPMPSEEMEQKFKEFCITMGKKYIEREYKRDYWRIIDLP